MKLKKYSLSQENILSLIPSLFPYIEWDEKNECSLHRSSDSHNGSYGHIVPNMRLNDGRIFTYKELIRKYKEGNDTVLNEYVRKAIGRVDIDKTLFDKDLELLPDYVYLSNVKTLYFQYMTVKSMCNENDDSTVQQCCICEKYRKMGGDTMLKLLNDLIPKADEISEEYYNYAVTDNINSLKLNFELPLLQSIDDIGYIESPLEEWKSNKKYYKGECVIYNSDIYRCKSNDGSNGKYNEQTEKIDFDNNAWELASKGNVLQKTVRGTVNSKLTSLRRYTEYLNGNDEAETPSNSEDWLFFYRKGYVANYRTVNDTLGNITHIGNDYTNGDDLMAYGDVLTDITFDEDERTLSFKYALDAHLKATYQKSETDDDGNIKYLFSNFKYDENDKLHGVIYTDTYSYLEDGDIDKLIKSGGFKDYINEGTLNNDIFNMFTKFEFNTSYSSIVYDANCGDTIVPISSSISTFESIYNDDAVSVPTIRRDYFNGISYVPSKEVDVNINRGNTSAIEKHIKFSEVKTLEDMELFSNGGFFIMKEDS